MKAYELIKALEEGRILGFNHAKKPGNEEEYSDEESNSFNYTEFLFVQKWNDRKVLTRKGWCSAIGDTNTILNSVFMNPELWKVYFNSEEDFANYWKNKYCKSEY